MTRNDMAPVIIGKLLNIGGMLARNGNQLLQPFGLNQHQYSILFSINQESPVSQKNVINKLLLEKAHVSKVVKKLHSMGLITVEESPEDRRSSRLSITARGRQTVRDCQEHLHQWNDTWMEDLTDAQMNRILDSLDILQKTYAGKTAEAADLSP